MVMNVERFHSQAAKLNGYDVTVIEDLVCSIIIAYITWAAGQEWGDEFRDTMRKIRLQYAIQKLHTAVTCAEITRHLAGADKPAIFRSKHLPVARKMQSRKG